MTIAIRVSLPSISATLGLWFLCCSYLPLMLSLRKQPTFGDATTGFPAKWRLRNERRNSILMTRHYPDLGSISDWLNQISYAARPIRSPNQIWVVTCHQYGISALVSQTSFDGETSGDDALWNNVYVSLIHVTQQIRLFLGCKKMLKKLGDTSIYQGKLLLQRVMWLPCVAWLLVNLSNQKSVFTRLLTTWFVARPCG